MIYICIPTHDEERTIGVMLWKIRTVMADFQRDYQILVADDASTDGTPEVLEPYTRILPLTVFRNPQRRGYAASLEMLLREAVRRSTYPKRDIIVTIQGDFTDEPAEIPSLVKRIEGGVDIVTTNLRPGLDRAPRSVRWAWRLFGFLLRRLRWPDEVSDPISGFRAYRVVAVKKAIETRTGALLGGWEGWAANAALLRAVAPFARRVEEAPVKVRYDRRARPTRFRTLETGRDVLRFVLAARKNGSIPVRDATVEPIDAAALEVRSTESIISRAPKPLAPSGRGRRGGASAAGGGARTARDGGRSQSSSRTRGGRRRKAEVRNGEVLAGSAAEVGGATAGGAVAGGAAVGGVAAGGTAVERLPAPGIDADTNETTARAPGGTHAERTPGTTDATRRDPGTTDNPAGTAVEAGSAVGDAGGKPSARRSGSRRSGGRRTSRSGAARAADTGGSNRGGAPGSEPSGGIEGAAAVEPAAGRALSSGIEPTAGIAIPAGTEPERGVASVQTGDSLPGGESPPAAGAEVALAGPDSPEAGDALAEGAAPAASRTGGARRRGRRGGRRAGARRGTGRSAEPATEGAPEVESDAEESRE